MCHVSFVWLCSKCEWCDDCIQYANATYSFMQRLKAANEYAAPRVLAEYGLRLRESACVCAIGCACIMFVCIYRQQEWHKAANEIAAPCAHGECDLRARELACVCARRTATH